MFNIFFNMCASFDNLSQPVSLTDSTSADGLDTSAQSGLNSKFWLWGLHTASLLYMCARECAQTHPCYSKYPTMSCSFVCSYNKQVLKVFPYPLTCTALQFGVGAVIASVMWLTNLHEKPKVDAEIVSRLAHTSDEGL